MYICSEITKFLKQRPIFNNLQIDKYAIAPKSQKIELHGFCMQVNMLMVHVFIYVL